MINRIFISTNKIQWDNLFSVEDDGFSERLAMFKNTIALDRNNPSFTIEGIVFLFDGLDNLPTIISIKKETDLLLWHTATKDSIKSEFTIKDRSQHSESDLNSMYRRIFKILLNEDDNAEKQKSIIGLFDYLDKEKTERLKTDFLYHIYNGNKPSSFTKRAEEIKDIDTYKDLYEVFENPTYNKQLDFNEDEEIGADQRKKLSLLRDALLTKK